jgi:hypothetical protein
LVRGLKQRELGLVVITGPMKDGVVQYGDTFIQGVQHNQKSTERRLMEALQHYSAFESQDFMRGMLVANQILKGDRMIPRKTNLS